MISIWSLIGVGGIILLIAAMKKKNHQLCKGYEVVITGPEEQIFIDKNDVEEILFGNNRQIANKPFASFDLFKMEEKLEKNVWIEDAELFFDNNGILKIRVKEREPIARVFTVTGSTYYVDTSCAQLPLSDKLAPHLPVFTGFPTDRKKPGKDDSLLMRQIVHISQFINQNRFWKDQIEQIDITQARTFEMIPLVGNHIVTLGDGNDIEKKFAKLFIFYQQVMSKTGFDSYQKLDLQFAKQIVATKKWATLSKRDSLMAVAKVKQLIQEARQMQPDTMQQKKVKPLEKQSMNEEGLKSIDLLPAKPDSVNKNINQVVRRQETGVIKN